MNLPNKLTILRICLVPIFVVAYLLPYHWGSYVAAGLFVAAAATDFLDGYIARKYNMITTLGKFLDPIADKILICAALFCVVATNPLSFSAYESAEEFGMILLAVGAMIIISRELLISAMRQIAASKAVVVQANMFGKVKTVCQDIALPMLVLLNAPSVKAHGIYTTSLFWDIWWLASVLLFGVAVAFTIASGVVYLVEYRKVFAN